MQRKFWFGKKLILMTAAIAALGGLVMSLWNWILPALFTSAQPIDYWRALGLLVLCRVLFGGFHGHGGWQRHQHMQRWHQMTDEERRKFRAGLTGFRAWHHDWHEQHDSRHGHPWHHQPESSGPSAQDAAKRE